MQSSTAVSTVNIPKSRRSCSWTYRITKLLVNPKEHFNNIILERTIKNHGRFPSDKTFFCRLWLICCQRLTDWNHTVNLKLCFRTYSHTYFPIKGIDKCQQQWFLTAIFSNIKKRTKVNTYTTFSLQCIEWMIAKQRKSPGQSRSQALSCYPLRSTQQPIHNKEFEKSRFKSILGRCSSYVECNNLWRKYLGFSYLYDVRLGQTICRTKRQIKNVVNKQIHVI